VSTLHNPEPVSGSIPIFAFTRLLTPARNAHPRRRQLVLGQLEDRTTPTVFNMAPGAPFLTAGSGVDWVSTGDFNTDGTPDLAVANGSSNTVAIFLGNGSGGFALASGSPFSSGGTAPRAISVADFSGDGKLDLAVVNQVNTVAIFNGNGAGAFAQVGAFTPPGSFAWASAIGDLNGDGTPDLVITSLSNTVAAYLNDGTGTFTLAAGSPLATPAMPYSTAVADFNGDSQLDLAVAGSTSGTIQVFLGNGAGGFAPGNSFTAGGGPRSVVAADLNGDGRVDLAVAYRSNSVLSIFQGSGTGTFSNAGNLSLGAPSSYSVVTADMNGDSKLDLVATTANNSVLVYFGSGNFSFPSSMAVFANGTLLFNVVAADFNGDGKPDLTTANNSSGNVSVLMNGNPTKTNLSSSSPTAVWGQPVTFTATVTPGPGFTGVPPGVVNFLKGTTVLQSVPVNGSGVATFTTSTLGLGNHSITAVYSDGVTGNNQGSKSAVVAQQINTADTTTTLATSGSPVTAGQSVTLTATVTANSPSTATPTGIVAFFDGTTLLGTSTLSGNVATLSTANLGAGMHSISAHYNASGNFSASPTSNTVAQYIAQAATTVTLAGSGSPTSYGQSATFTATISVAAPGSGTPTGTVTFFDSANPVGTVVASSGVAVLTTATLGVASHNITAVYSGNADYSASPASNSVTEQVNQAATTATLNAAGTTTFGQVATFTATVDVTAPGGGTPAGTVTFVIDSATSAGSIPLVGGIAVLNTTTLPPGSHSIVAQYNGSTNHGASPVSNTVTQVVNGLPTLGGVPGLAQVDELTQLTFTATVANPDTPVFSLINAPIAAGIDGTGKFTWTPTEDQGPASYAFTVRVTDGATIDDRPITVVVNEVNTAPVLDELPTGLATAPGSTLSFAASAPDSDQINGKNNTVTYSLTGNVPVGAFIDPDTGGFSWTPNEFNSLGSYTFNVRASDDGVPSLSDSKSITVSLKPMVLDTGNGNLLIGGTSGNDTIAVALAKKDATKLTVTMNKVLLGTLPLTSVPNGIYIHGLAGNDSITVASKITQSAWLFGEAGNDKLTGGGGADVLVGGDGNDTLTDAVGISVMIGGQGVDKLTGGFGNALMIGGSTWFDASVNRLTNIQAEWTSGNANRIAHLQGAPGGFNGTTFLTGTTVQDDFVKDTLTGKKKGNGWFIVHALDKNDGTGLGDTVTPL
jgi:Bacterial Ig-like domain (group 3)/FG-GAP-like repeat/RTX calcium-binding nonapeptide repeat (4 copies)/FG-GAP repeat